MASHNVTVETRPRPLKRQDVTFVVRSDGEMFGTLKISNGSVVWFPSRTTNGCKMRWPKFDAVMQQYATSIEHR